MRRRMTVFACGLGWLAAAGAAGAQQRAHADDERRWPRINDRLELRYTVETEEDGERSPVAVTQGFASGERFSLRVRPTGDAYLYLFVSEADGVFTLVAPDLLEDGSFPDFVEGGSDARLPARTTLRLDEEPGVERLYLLASTEPLDEVDELLADERQRVGEAWLIDLRDHYARNGTLTRQVRNEAVRLDWRQRGRGAATVFETVAIRHYDPR